jgi:hypothetical protein
VVCYHVSGVPFRVGTLQYIQDLIHRHSLAAWALGLSLGPIFGGAIVQGTTWRWIFYLMFPICGFGLVAVPYLLTLRPKKATAQEKLSRIDWIGGFLFTGTTTIFLMAISWGGTQVGERPAIRLHNTNLQSVIVRLEQCRDTSPFDYRLRRHNCHGVLRSLHRPVPVPSEGSIPRYELYYNIYCGSLTGLHGM